jgi:hypothetical protein
MKPVLAAAILLLMILPAVRLEAETTQPLPVFFNKLYNRNKPRIDFILADTITNGLNNAGARNVGTYSREKIVPVIFYHLLFASSNAVNCAKGGVLNIPYFWHWVSPNPRHELIYLPSSAPLKEVKAPAGFEKYRSYSDADRTPYLYLSNLVSDSPLFSHPQCGSFFTFGWCSEREMAFSNLLSQFGYKMKIRQEGIHVWSEALVDVEENCRAGKLIIMVDNTFNIVRFSMLAKPESIWRLDFGHGTQVTWYNRKALSSDEMQKVRSIRVSEKASARISDLVEDWLKIRRREQ